MSNDHNYEIVELSETYVAGLALRTSNKTEQELMDKGWIAITWDEVRRLKGPASPAAAYTGYTGSNGNNGNFTVVIGSERKSTEDFETGEVITRIPDGKYAKFTKTADTPAHAAFSTWQEVWQAEEDGGLQRTYTADLELYSGEYGNKLTVTLYIAIK